VSELTSSSLTFARLQGTAAASLTTEDLVTVNRPDAVDGSASQCADYVLTRIAQAACLELLVQAEMDEVLPCTARTVADCGLTAPVTVLTAPVTVLTAPVTVLTAPVTVLTALDCCGAD
jgi:hypothetical protein